MKLAAGTVVLPPQPAPVEGLINIGTGAQDELVPCRAERFGVRKRVQRPK